MKNVMTLFAISAVFILSSFSYGEDYCTGTFSVSDSDPAQIKLTINPDHTFYYQDFSRSDNKIIAEGTWSLKGKKVILKSNSIMRFHDVWTIDENGNVAKSHKGLSYYRLCKLTD